MKKERRKFKRVRADFDVEYKVKDSKEQSRKAKGINISGGGIMMRAPEKLSPGTLIELKLELPPLCGLIHTFGQVVYSMDNLWNEDPPFRCGICFMDIVEEDRKNIDKFVQEKIKELDWQHWL